MKERMNLILKTTVIAFKGRKLTRLAAFVGVTWIVAISTMVVPLTAFAFGIDKVLVEIKPGLLKREATLRVFNDSERTTHYVAKVYDWQISPEGHEVLTPVTGLTVKPLVLRVTAKQSAEFTFKYSGSMDLKKEKTYRVIVQEFVGSIPDTPDAETAPKMASSLSISSQMSIPVYALPNSRVEPFEGAKISYYKKTDGLWMIKVINNGDKRFMLLALTLDGKREDRGTYVLAGSTIDMPLRKEEAVTTAIPGAPPAAVEAILRFGKEEKVIPVKMD